MKWSDLVPVNPSTNVSNMAGENDSTETARPRQIVREEIARSGDRHSITLSTQSVYERTQELIRGAANTAVNELSQIWPQQVLATMPTTAPRAIVQSILAIRDYYHFQRSSFSHDWNWIEWEAIERQFSHFSAILNMWCRAGIWNLL